MKPEEFRAGLEAKCQQLAGLIGHDMPKEVGFALLLFNFGEGGFMTYCSNAKRNDMIKALKEMIQKLEMGGSWN